MNPIEYSRMYDAEDRHWWYAGLHDLILATVRRESQRLGRPLHIFDAGCGTGRLCQLLAAEGHHVSGCDASDEALRLSRKRGSMNVFQADLNSLELKPETFDVITSIDVLYHSGITDDVAVMKRLRNGLKPGGMLILNLVAHEFLRSTHDIAVHTRERYTRKLLRDRLIEAGFIINFISYRVSLLFPFIALYRLFFKYTLSNKTALHTVASDVQPPHPLINYLLLKLLELENTLMSITTLPTGSSVFVIAHGPSENMGS